jgi:hypothetical protein
MGEPDSRTVPNTFKIKKESRKFPKELAVDKVIRVTSDK